MSEVLEVDLAEFERQFSRFALLSRRSLEDEFRHQVKGLIKEVVDITPPAHGKGTRGRARKMGQKKIATDLVGGGSGRGRRRAGVFTVLSDSLIDSAIETGAYEGGENVRLWVTKDGRVYGTQRHFFRPDASMTEMRAHHKRYFKNGEMSRAGTYTRDIARWRWIDQMVVRVSTFNRYLKSQQRKVGFYAAGFAPALAGTRQPLPVYMRGHVTEGTFVLSLGDTTLEMRAANRVGYSRLDRHLRRRVEWAARAQAGKMERQIPYLIRHHARVVT